MSKPVEPSDALALQFDPEELRLKYRVEREKRVRSEGIDQYVEVDGDFAYLGADVTAAVLPREALFDEVDVVVLGAGMGGLMAGARLREVGLERIRLVDKASDVGGTWFWNQYPGAQCDVESYIYMPLLEEVGHVPSEKYAHQPEILEHCRAIARKYDLYRDACFQTECTEIRWDDAAGCWWICTDRGDRMRARFVVVASGVLSKPKLPGISGIQSFKGHMFHTSRWDYDYTGGGAEGGLDRLADKRVALIGTGATAIQVVPHLGASARQLYVFQRTPSSVSERNNRLTDPEWARDLKSGWQRARMANFDVVVSGGFQGDDQVNDGWTAMFRTLATFIAAGADISDGRAAELAELADFQTMDGLRSRIDAVVHDPSTANSLKPWYRMFCKRPCFSDDFLPTFNRENVTLVDTDGRGVERITETSVVVGGVEYPVDCIIFATGFEVGTNYTRRVGSDFIGRNGARLSQRWADGLQTLHGLQTRDFPGCFFLGATQGAFTVNFHHMLDEQTEHVAYIVRRAIAAGASRIEVSAEAQQDWVREFHEAASVNQSFLAECTPGFFNAEGNARNPHGLPAAVYGRGSQAFFQLLRDWREEGSMAGVELTIDQPA